MPALTVNIIGAGLSGLSAAIALAEHGAQVRLISRQDSERAQSVMAEGGINACLNTMGDDDTWQEHFADSMKGGVWLADPNAVEGLTRCAPDVVRWLHRLGMPFNLKDGKIQQRYFGGQKKRRTAFAMSSTGKMLTATLTDECRKHEAAGRIVRLSHHDFVRFLIDDADSTSYKGQTSVTSATGATSTTGADARHCRGVRIQDTFCDQVYDCAGPVIMCSGGMNGMLPGHTTGTTQNSGDVDVIAFAQGVKFANLEMIQYHPTTISIPGKRCLVSEAARGEGGRLFIMRAGEPWYFMEEKYPVLKNLMPRDVVSREMYFVSGSKECEDQVYLDLTCLSAEIWAQKLSDMRDEISHYLDIDPAQTPVPVAPGIHYFMGGVYVDEQHRSSIVGLYAAGECSCQYHGANRLGGNSTLGAVYGGHVAASTVLADAGVAGVADTALAGAAVCATADFKAAAKTEASGHDGALLQGMRLVGDGEISSERYLQPFTPHIDRVIGDILREGLGIVRDESGMQAALEHIERIADEMAVCARDKVRCNFARAMVLSALARKESRGAQCRSDFPEKDDVHFRKTTVATAHADSVEIEFVDIPEKREGASCTKDAEQGSGGERQQ